MVTAIDAAHQKVEMIAFIYLVKSIYLAKSIYKFSIYKLNKNNTVIYLVKSIYKFSVYK